MTTLIIFFSAAFRQKKAGAALWEPPAPEYSLLRP
jgi:hypothetical protein